MVPTVSVIYTVENLLVGVDDFGEKKKYHLAALGGLAHRLQISEVSGQFN